MTNREPPKWTATQTGTQWPSAPPWAGCSCRTPEPNATRHTRQPHSSTSRNPAGWNPPTTTARVAGSTPRCTTWRTTLLRLLVVNHPFIDRNKRTALNTVAVFYFLNGYRFEYDEAVRGYLKDFCTTAPTVDRSIGTADRKEHTHSIDPEDAIEPRREELLDYGFDQLLDDPGDQHGYRESATQERHGYGGPPEIDAPIDQVLAHIHRELLLRGAEADRDDHRDVHDAQQTQ